MALVELDGLDHKLPLKTIRIHINTSDQPRPVVFNYRQLYKRELKKKEGGLEEDPISEDPNDFYNELVKKAEAYAIVDGEEDDDEEEENTTLESKKQMGNDYDFEDPFIDDSEMLLDEPQEYTAPEFDGFFVYHGPLDGHEGDEKKTSHPKRKTTSRPKNSSHPTKRGGSGNSTTTPPRKKPDEPEKKPKEASPKPIPKKPIQLPPVPVPAPTVETTTPLVVPTKRPSLVVPTIIKKKKKLDEELAQPILQEEPDKTKKKSVLPPTLKPLDPEIEVLIEKLKRDVKFETFENKAKFPLSLKPTVLEIGLVTFRKNKTVDDNLVYHLMNILPYNRFTLKKFLTTKSGQMRVDELQQEIDELAILLKQTIDRMMPEQRRLFNEKLAQAQANGNVTTEDEDVPTPKFKCNDEVRKILYDIIQTEEQSIHIANQVALHKDSEKKPEGLASDGKARKLMYQRLLSCWPEGWMHSYEMSRQYSQYKSKIAVLSDKKASHSIPTTPKTIITSTDPKPSPSQSQQKRKKPEESSLKKDSSKSLDTKKPSQVITIDTDDDVDDAATVKPWNKSNSMKIESLISGPSQDKKL